jgi:putative pyruvate formate lyase activating enzyme
MWRILRPDSAYVLKDTNARTSLSRYFNVMENDKVAKFRIARKLAAPFSNDDSTSSLWKAHRRLLKDFQRIENRIDSRMLNYETMETPSKSFLDLKLELSKRILQSCHFCTRRCSVDRTKGALGYCKCGSQILVSTLFEHMGEEPELVPSGTIFTLGCTMRCLHCQNWTISQWKERGEPYSIQRLASAIEHLRSNGCRNVNLVGGDPTPWLSHWLEVLKHVNVNVPVVWNSNSYYSPETARLLAGFADIYLLDFKYGSNECSQRISDAPEYWEACTRNHRDGAKYGEVIVRILVLPDHLHCCMHKTLKWIRKELGIQTRTNLMFQYRPEWRAQEIPELKRSLSKSEKENALRLARETGLINVIT